MIETYWLLFPKASHGKTYAGQTISSEPVRALSYESAMRMIYQHDAEQVDAPTFSYDGKSVKQLEQAIAEGLVTVEAVHAAELERSSYRKSVAAITGHKLS